VYLRSLRRQNAKSCCTHTLRFCQTISAYNHGNAKAIIKPDGFSGVPPTDKATYCFPFTWYVHAVAFARAGKVVCQSSFPVALSKARNFLFSVPLKENSLNCFHLFYK